MLKTDQYNLVLAVMKSKHKHKTHCECEKEMHEVIDALRISGFCIVPMGVINALKKMVGGIHQ